MADLDLDIHHYSLQDMKTFFRLDTSFTEKDVEKREYEIREQLLSSGHIHKKLKSDLIAFLTEVKNNILSNSFPKKEYKSPVLEKKLDTTPSIPKVEYPPSDVREREILQRPSTSYMYTQNSDYLPGLLNPVQTRILTQCISIDTRFRENAYTTQSSDFAMNIPNKLKKVVSMQLSSIELSLDSFYNISHSLQNNYLYILVHTEEEEYSDIFCLPDGRYTPEKLIFTLNMFLKESINTPFQYIQFLLDPFGSKRVCLESMDDSILSISLDFSLDEQGNSDKNTVDYSSKLGRILGFTKRKYNGAQKYIGETAINVNIDFSYIFLSIDDFQNNAPPSFISVFPKNKMSNAVLARIQIPEKRENLSPITFISEPRKYFGPIDLTRIQIRVLDAYGRILDLNGADYSFCLLFHLVYDL